MRDKTVVLTGATSGLGRATALQLAQKGAFVVIIARSNTKANVVINEIKKEGGKGQFVISDLSSMKDTKEAAENITRIDGDQGPLRTKHEVDEKLLILERPPETLDKNVILNSTTSVHTDLNALGFQQTCEAPAGRLRSLVDVEDFRNAVTPDGFIDGINTKFAVQGV
jgi:NAD(P)-dependent dehydrogenase (short-subunit alcohol dehydrogenase family)